jgi:hypothetical protein
MAKILHREVRAAHDAWARAATEWGDNNLETVRKLGAYQDARARYEREHGKPWQFNPNRPRRAS